MATEPVTVLLVDDQPLVAAAVRRLLSAAPEFVLQYCPRPAAAVDEAAALAGGAVVVMVDTVMPEVDGLEVVRRMRATPATAGLPVVMMSVDEAPQSKAAAFAAGADDYVVKLPDGVELVARLRALLRRANR